MVLQINNIVYLKLKKFGKSKGTFVTLEDLEQMDIDVLNKLRNNSNILNLGRKL